MESFECFLEDASRIGGYTLDSCELLPAGIERAVESLKCFVWKLP
jgi:hypothetical protein